MNAYELADEYEYTKKEHDAFMENPTDANRIAVLCKRDEFSKKLIRQQADRIAELEKFTKAILKKGGYPYEQSEPVAWVYETKNVDGKPYLTNVSLKPLFGLVTRYGYKEIPLYTTPQTELNDGGEPVKNATYWKRQYNLMASQNDNLKSGLYHANEQIKYLESTPQTKPLSGGEILEIASNVVCTQSLTDDWRIHFARAIEAKVRGQ